MEVSPRPRAWRKTKPLIVPVQSTPCRNRTQVRYRGSRSSIQAPSHRASRLRSENHIIARLARCSRAASTPRVPALQDARRRGLAGVVIARSVLKPPDRRGARFQARGVVLTH